MKTRIHQRKQATQSGRAAPGSSSSSDQSFEPGSPVRVVHSKPWKRTITAAGTVVGYEDGVLKIERSFSAGGYYDSLNVPKLGGDYGFIEVAEGSKVLRRSYYRRDGQLVGELYNIQTPARFETGQVRYIDLEVDVVRWPDGRVEVVDEADLEAAVRCRGITPDTAEQARGLAHRLAEILRQGGDWRDADDLE